MAELLCVDQGSVHGSEEVPSLDSYDIVVVCMSGGKDSLACVLHLLDLGVDPSRIELHHHLVDGREGSTLFDWPVTESYCKAFAKAFGMKIVMSWKVGGIEGEMMRENEPTAAIAFETEGMQVMRIGGDSKRLGTRLKFPQVSASLNTRWCSSYAKIDVLARLITHEPRFRSARTLVVTGERAEESSSRARYEVFTRHRTDNREGRSAPRHVDQWRAVHRWDTTAIWQIIARYRVNPHPAYWCGWGRVSCRTCIFGSCNQWATIRTYMPDVFEAIAVREESFGVTIHRKLTVRQQADRGVAYDVDPAMLALAIDEHYRGDIVVQGQWRYPPGAFGESSGPT